jgi:hypothetical protein
MRVALMQPYLFPYVGYFQLMAGCDLFVVRDEVQYIRGGWINRNRILLDGRPRWLTLPVAAADHRLPINRRTYLLDARVLRHIRRQLEAAYRQAPHFRATMNVVDEVLACEDANVARFNVHALRRVAAHLGIHTPLQLGSALPPSDMHGASRVIEMCRQLGATTYVNAIGGVQLYRAEAFAAAGLALRFVASSPSPYVQFHSSFVPGLSIIDVLMFNDRSAVTGMLGAFRPVTSPTDCPGAAAS